MNIGFSVATSMVAYFSLICEMWALDLTARQVLLACQLHVTAAARPVGYLTRQPGSPIAFVAMREVHNCEPPHQLLSANRHYQLLFRQL
jgi:hypothetical protein